MIKTWMIEGEINDPFSEFFVTTDPNVPDDWNWSAFSLGRDQMAYVAASVLAGGNVRVGLEDNLYLDKGALAENWQLVERAGNIISNLGQLFLE